MATPKIIPYTVKLRSVVPEKTFSKPPVVYTNDLRSAEFQFKITDMDASELLTATAKTMLYMRDGSFFQNQSTDVSRVGNVFSYLLKENEGNHAGIAKIQLVVYFNEGLANEQNFPTQLYEFEIINGLETKVAQEVMIYDWTTLTRDARAYIDQFVADELLRDAEFDNNEFDRNTAFVASQDARTLAFGTEQTNRGTVFTAEQNERTAAFDESESGRTTAETGRVTAEEGRVEAETDRVTEEGKRVTAESGRVTEEGKRVTAESGRVTAESARATAETNRAAAFTAFDTRLTAEETATANNKISAVKGKTFADVDARLEDVEADTALMGTNLVTNGDFSNGTTGWSNDGASLSVSNNTLSASGSGASANPGTLQIIGTVVAGSKYYLRAKVRVTNTLCTSLLFRLTFGTGSTVSVGTISSPIQSQWYAIGAIFTQTDQSGNFTMIVRSTYADAATASGKVMETQYVEVFNLTAIFGAGNEPTAEQMDGIMAKFTNSWFDGTKNLFRANAALNKLMAVDARTEFEAKNEVANGDFSNGTTGWAAAGSTIAVANNELAVTQSVDWNSRAITTPAFVTSGTNMFYIAANVKATVNTVGINLDSYAVGLKYHSGSGAYERLSAVVTNSNPSHNLYLVDKGTLAVPARTSYVKNAIVINLTAAFGAGKEPTLAEMDRLMARFPNFWFDGVKPIQTIETLYLEKANKVQEAWITPTLLNGAVPVASKPPQYYKDEFGAVVVQGLVTVTSLNSDIFTLPIGYRPTKSKVLPTTANNNSFASVLVKTTGEVQLLSGTLASVSVDCIRFKAEQ